MVKELVHGGPISSVGFSPDGSYVLTSDEQLPGEEIESVAFAPSADSVVAGSAEGVIKVWDANTGVGRLTVAPRDGHVRSVRFSANAENVIASTSGAIHCYNATDGSEWQALRSNFGIGNAAIAPDGSAAVDVGLGRAVVYSFRFEDLLSAARNRVPAIGKVPED